MKGKISAVFLILSISISSTKYILYIDYIVFENKRLKRYFFYEINLK